MKNNDFDFEKPVVSGSRHHRSPRSLMRIFIWFLVFVWCMIPPIWSLGFVAEVVVNSIQEASATPKNKKAQFPKEVEERPRIAASSSPVYSMLSGSVMFVLFAYAIWCAAGVICGQGMERTWIAFTGG